MATTKTYNYSIEKDIFFAIQTRSVLESEITGKKVTFKDILDRAVQKEVKGFKPLIKKKG